MRRTVKHVTLLILALALLLVQLACAESSEAVKGIFEALTAEDSDFSQTMAMYAEFEPNLAREETLEGDSFTITISGSEYMSGSWTFTRDGDYLAATLEDDDFNGVAMALDVIEAIGKYYGMNTKLINPYINGLTALGIESENFIATKDEAAGTETIKLNISGPWDMKELDEMAFEGALLDYYEPLDADFISMGGGVGKLMMLVNGTADHATMLLGEYGGLDELAHRSIVNIVNALKPAGWENFAAGYAELADAQTEGWTVRLNVGAEEVREIIDEADEDYGYALIEFGGGANYGSVYEEDAYDDEMFTAAEAPSVEALAEGYFAPVAGLESGTAGASLKTAVAASEVCAFAESYELYDPDVVPLRDNMLAAFEAMSADDQARFWDGFEAIRALLDDSLDNYEAFRPIFEDAGVAEAMDEVMFDPLNRLAWENLRDHTLTMGNDMNAG